jgi:predicted nucleotidyltransferase
MTEYNPQQKPGVKTRFIGVETILIDGERHLKLNPPAAFVWKRCDGAHSLDDIEQEIRAQVRLPADKNLHAEIIVILEYFRKHDLLINEHPAGNDNQLETKMTRQDHTGYYLGKYLLDQPTYRMLLELAACDVDKPLPRLQVDWAELLKAIQYHGVTGLVYYKLFKLKDPHYPPPDFQKTVIRRHQIRAVQIAEKYDMVRAILTSLAELGIDVIALKGAAVAHAYFPQAPLRYFIDLDLFAKKDHREALEAVLSKLGYELAPGYEKTMPKLIPSVITQRHTRFEHNQVKMPVEVHWEDLVQDDLVPRDLDGMWRRAIPITIDGVPAKTLAIEDHLLHLCAHAHYHHFDRLCRLTDLLFILRDHGKELNWEEFLDTVALEEVHMPVYQSFKLLEQLFGLTFPGWVMKKLKPNWFRLWWHKRFFKVKVLLPHEDHEHTEFSFKSTPWIRSTFLNLMIMGRRREKMHYLLRLLFPTTEWLRQRYNLPVDRSLMKFYIFRLILPPKLMDLLTQKK